MDIVECAESTQEISIYNDEVRWRVMRWVGEVTDLNADTRPMLAVLMASDAYKIHLNELGAEEDRHLLNHGLNLLYPRVIGLVVLRKVYGATDLESAEIAQFAKFETRAGLVRSILEDNSGYISSSVRQFIAGNTEGVGRDSRLLALESSVQDNVAPRSVSLQVFHALKPEIMDSEMHVATVSERVYALHQHKNLKNAFNSLSLSDRALLISHLSLLSHDQIAVDIESTKQDVEERLLAAIRRVEKRVSFPPLPFYGLNTPISRGYHTAVLKRLARSPLYEEWLVTIPHSDRVAQELEAILQEDSVVRAAEKLGVPYPTLIENFKNAVRRIDDARRGVVTAGWVVDNKEYISKLIDPESKDVLRVMPVNHRMAFVGFALGVQPKDLKRMGVKVVNGEAKYVLQLYERIRRTNT